MTRLADRVVLEGVKVGFSHRTPAAAARKCSPALAEYQDNLNAWLREAVPQNPTIVVDNVTQYFFDNLLAKNWDQERDFPNVAPPIETMFIETRAPSPRGKWIEDNVLGWGSLFRTWENDRAEWHWRGRWHTEVTNVYETTSDGVIAYPITLLIKIHGDGSLVHEPGKNLQYGWGTDPGLEPLADNELAHRLYADTCVFMLALSFFHCKNVQVRDGTINRRTARTHTRQYGVPPEKYYVLEIEPMKQVLRTEGGAETAGIEKALHICRGHFKDFREKGLFGRHHDIFWWDDHVRGNFEKGITIKDYEVEEPDER